MTIATSIASREREALLSSFTLALDAAGLSPATLRLYRHGIKKLYAYLNRIGIEA